MNFTDVCFTDTFVPRTSHVLDSGRLAESGLGWNLGNTERDLSAPRLENT